jgi:hypothetical protein
MKRAHKLNLRDQTHARSGTSILVARSKVKKMNRVTLEQQYLDMLKHRERILRGIEKAPTDSQKWARLKLLCTHELKMGKLAQELVRQGRVIAG